MTTVISACGGGGGSPNDGSSFSKISSGSVGNGESAVGKGELVVSPVGTEVQVTEFNTEKADIVPLIEGTSKTEVGTQSDECVLD